MLRIPYGLDRLPRTLRLDDPRLPAVLVGDVPLRLNTEALPPAAMPDVMGDHAARVAAMTVWLQGLCGDYAPLRQRFIAAYIACVAAEVAACRAVLAEELRGYDSLYAPEDFLWSAPRPLPRAWLPAGNERVFAEIGFWDGEKSLAIELSARETPRQAALQRAGIRVVRLEPAALDDLPERLPELVRGFWRGERLPMSPFRRPVPRGVVGERA
jgi:hypothetical protein